MYLFVDTETTGFPTRGVQPRIVSIAWMIAAEPERPRVFKCKIVRPDGFEIPQAASAVHGISTERARREGAPLKDVLLEFGSDVLTLLPRAVVAHNLAYDRPIIDSECLGAGVSGAIENLPGKCTMLAARKRWPGHSAKLLDVYQRLFRANLSNAHNAGADVWACHKVFFACDLQ